MKRFSSLSRSTKPIRRRKPIPKVNVERQAKKRHRYESHLKSAYWKALRLQVWERISALHKTRGICEACGRFIESIKAMQCAHLTYSHFGKERLSDVQGQCRDCNMAERKSRSWYKGPLKGGYLIDRVRQSAMRRSA